MRVLLVGLGGTGTNILRRTINLMDDRGFNDKRTSSMKFIGVDTTIAGDSSDLANLDDYIQIAVPKPAQWVQNCI